jgi:hypothetical protein
MATQNAQLQPVNPQSLKEFNDVLVQLGLPALSQDQMTRLRADQPRDRLVKALNLARTDTGAREFLRRNLERVGAIANQAPQQAAPAAPQESFQPSPAPVQRQDPPQTPPPEDYRQGHGEARPAAPSQQRPQEQTRTDQGRSGNRLQDENLSHHVYGGKAALCFETDTTRGGEDGKNAIFTICLDGAASTAPRKYDWKNKVRVQLTRDELPQATAVLMGMMPFFEGKNHGPQNDKGFSIEDQGDKFFVRVFAKDVPVKAVPMTPEDAFYVAQLFVRQLRKNAPWLSGQDLMTLLKTVVANRKQARPNQQRGGQQGR